LEFALDLTTTDNAPPPEPGAVANAPPPAGKSLLREIIETVLLTVIIYIAVNFATGRFRIEGSSMEPSMHPNQYVLVDKLTYMLGDPKRGDVVVFNYPLATERDFIKRVIGLPGETVVVTDGRVLVNGTALDEPYISAPPNYENTWELGPDEFFVLGDNRNSSSDSHSWGPLGRQYLIGRAIFVYWPPTLWGLVPHYSYAASPTVSATSEPGAEPTQMPGVSGYPATTPTPVPPTSSLPPTAYPPTAIPPTLPPPTPYP
jgi:signal peptidase I